MSKWKIAPAGTSSMVKVMLENQLKCFDERLIEGPYFCDEQGDYVTTEQAADPAYIPHIVFGKWDENLSYVFNLKTEEFFEKSGDEIYQISREDIDDILANVVFDDIPKLHNGGSIGDFVKFAMPLIRQSFPSLSSQNLVSGQPMTQPIASTFYMKNRYGYTK